MLDTKELQERRGDMLDEAQALSALAIEENRELTDEEAGRIDSILGQGTAGDDGYRAGTIAKLDADLARARRLEELQAAQARQRTGEIRLTAQGAPRCPAAVAKSVHSKLHAFVGPDAAFEAYSSGQWFRAVFYKNESATRWCRDNGLDIRSALEGGSNSAGGYLVPDELERAIIQLREERGVMRRKARIVQMGSDKLSVPRRSSGLTGYWLDENGSITASDKSWDNVTLVAKKLGALVKYSSELAEDAVINLADDLASEIAYTFANSEDLAGFIGDGTSTYGGISGLITQIAAGSTITAAAGNTAYSTLDLTDFEDMLGALPEYPGMDPEWFIHKAGWAASMLRLQAAAGGNTIATVGQGPMAQTFLGYPINFVQVMNSTTTAQTSTDGLCYFGDMRATATFGTRRGISLQVSADRYFELDQLAIKGTERIDIAVHETDSSMIMLATPGS